MNRIRMLHSVLQNCLWSYWKRQFPIDYPRAALVLRTPTDYANRLSVHVNHLNKVIKETTGKTTSVLIAERIVKKLFNICNIAIFLFQKWHLDWALGLFPTLVSSFVNIQVSRRLKSGEGNYLICTKDDLNSTHPSVR